MGFLQQSEYPQDEYPADEYPQNNYEQDAYGQDDYLDLEQLKGDDYKKVLLEFNLGYSEKGYLDMCHRCHGLDEKNYPIPIAEQL